MAEIVGITGTPGTGKKSISPHAAESLGLECLGINDLARRSGLADPRTGDVDVKLLRSRIARRVTGPALLYGHLLPYVLDPRSVRVAVVLRCSPEVLKKRLAARGYAARKVQENVEAELIGVVSADTFGAFGSTKTLEFDTTSSSPTGAAQRIAKLVKEGRAPPRIDWTLRYDSGAKLRSLLSS